METCSGIRVIQGVIIMNKVKLYSLKEITEDNSQPPEPIIDNGVLLDGTILLIIGPPKSKKTFLTQNLAIAIASGQDFAGFKVPEAKKVMYLLAEGGYYPNRDRLKKMAPNIDANLILGHPATFQSTGQTIMIIYMNSLRKTIQMFSY